MHGLNGEQAFRFVTLNYPSSASLNSSKRNLPATFCTVLPYKMQVQLVQVKHRAQAHFKNILTHRRFKCVHFLWVTLHFSTSKKTHCRVAKQCRNTFSFSMLPVPQNT